MENALTIDQNNGFYFKTQVRLIGADLGIAAIKHEAKSLKSLCRAGNLSPHSAYEQMLLKEDCSAALNLNLKLL